MIKTSKKIFFCLIFLTSFLLWQTAHAADYYAAQSAAGTGNGDSCENARAISYYSGSWSGKISAGDTLHLCGTLTSTLTIGGSGSSGNPITVKFEDGAKFSKSAWGIDASSAIYSTGKNYITIDGGTNGIIENTDNGTIFGIKQDTNAINVVSSSNWTIKNLTVKTMYTRTPDSDDSNKYGKGIVIISSNSVILDNLDISDMYYGVYAYASGSNADGLTIQNSSISRVSTGIVAGLNSANDYTNVLIDNVTIFDLYVWDGCWGSCTSTNEWHHNDGIHTWGNHGDGVNKIQITIKNSTIGGDFGGHTTGWIFVSDYTTDVSIYDNLLYTTGGPPSDGYVVLGTYGTGTARIYNNTIKGWATNNTGGTGIYFGAKGTWEAHIKNNIINNVYVGIVSRISTVTLTSDYNILYGYTSPGADGDAQKNKAQWQALGYDLETSSGHSIYADPKFVSASDFSLQAGSPAINAGADLSSSFTTDILGATRSGVWDIGAYEYTGAADVVAPAAPNGLAVS